jgi:hypothetical protein
MFKKFEEIFSTALTPFISISKNIEHSIDYEELIHKNYFSIAADDIPFWISIKKTRKFISGYRILESVKIINGIVLNNKNEVELNSILTDTRYLRLMNSNHLIIFNRFLKYTKIKNAVTLTNYLSGNYYHWLFDVLASLKNLPAEDLKKLQFILPANCTEFQKSSLLYLFNISENQIHTLGKKEIIVEKLFVPNTSFYQFYGFNRKIKIYDQRIYDFYRTKLINDQHYLPFCVTYVSRSKSFRRKIINENELFQSFIENQIEFNVVNCEDMKFVEQVELFKKSSVIIGPHGAGLSNIVFSSKASLLIELYPQTRDVKDIFYFYQITNKLSIEHKTYLLKSINILEDMVISSNIIAQITDLCKSRSLANI